jgi:AraC-like DNA-binding protein
LTAQLTDSIKIPTAFWTGLRALGLSAADLVRQARLPLAVLTDKAVVTTRQYFALWQALDDLAGGDAIGIKLATAFSDGQLPPSLLAAYHARDYRDALQRMARYKLLCAPERLRLSEEGDTCHVSLEWLYTGQTEPVALVDASMATLLELGRRGTGAALSASLVDLARPKMDASAYEAYFGCRVRFDAQCNCLHLHRSDLGRAFVAYNAELLVLLIPALDQALAERQRSRSLSDTVRWLLEHQLSSGRPDIPAVAREIGVSERTLQRRLRGEGTSFQLLLTGVRRARARELLANTALDFGEAAFLLGYEDQNSFFRAFRLWEGKTPSCWRALHQNQESVQEAVSRGRYQDG